MGVLTEAVAPLRDCGAVSIKAAGQSDGSALREKNNVIRTRDLPPEQPEFVRQRFAGALTKQNVNELDGTRKTRLHWAVRRDEVQFARELLEFGANANIKDGDGETPLHYAVGGGNSQLIVMLVSCGANFLEQNVYGVSAADMVADGASSTLVCDLFGEELPEHVIQAQGPNLLHGVAKSGSVRGLRRCISVLGPVHVDVVNGQSLLTSACESGVLEVVQMVLDTFGMDSHVGAGGQGPLHCAARAGSPEILEALVAADVPVGDIGSLTTLLCSDAEMLSLELVGRLLRTAKRSEQVTILRDGNQVAFDPEVPLGEQVGKKVASEWVTKLVTLKGASRAHALSKLVDACDANVHAGLRELAALGALNKAECAPALVHLAYFGLRASFQYLVGYVKGSLLQCITCFSEAMHRLNARSTSCNSGHVGILESIIERIAPAENASSAVNHFEPAKRTGTLLYHAAVNLGSAGLTRALLSLGADPSLTGILGAGAHENCGIVAETMRSFIYDGCVMRSAEAIEDALWRGRNPGSMPLEVLLEAGAPINMCCSRGLAPAHYAVLSGSAKLLERVIVAGADINRAADEGDLMGSLRDTPMGLCTGHLVSLKSVPAGVLVDLIRVLTKTGCDMVVEGTPVMFRCVKMPKEYRLSIAEALLDAGESVKCEFNGRSLLSYTLLHGPCGALVRMLVSRGADPNEFCNGKPLLSIVRQNRPIANALMDLGADPLRSVDDGCSFAADVFGAVRDGAVEVLAMDVLTRCSSEIDLSQPCPKYPAMWHGAVSFTPAAFDVVLHHPSVDLNRPTAVHHAVRVGARQNLENMMHRGAKLLPDAEGRYPLSVAMAERRSFMELVAGPIHGECTICLDEADLYCIPECGDYFCRECLSRWCVSECGALEEIRCPRNNCTHTMDTERARRFMPRKEYDAWLQRIAEATCNRMEDFSWCPRCSAGGVVYCSTCICPDCGHVWCGFCHGDAHADDEECEREQEYRANEDYRKHFSRKCFHCKALTEHTGGCTHMTCAQCKKSWCWACGGPYVGKYSMDPSRCPCKD